MLCFSSWPYLHIGDTGIYKDGNASNFSPCDYYYHQHHWPFGGLEGMKRTVKSTDLKVQTIGQGEIRIQTKEELSVQIIQAQGSDEDSYRLSSQQEGTLDRQEDTTEP